MENKTIDITENRKIASAYTGSILIQINWKNIGVHIMKEGV